LNAHCYWLLREQGKSPVEATKEIEGKSTNFKNELLYGNGINFNDLPSWQKRGIGFYWKEIDKVGWNPVKEEEVSVKRNKIEVDLEIPMGDDYNQFISEILRNEMYRKTKNLSHN